MKKYILSKTDLLMFADFIRSRAKEEFRPQREDGMLHVISAEDLIAQIPARYKDVNDALGMLERRSANEHAEGEGYSAWMKQ